MRIALLNTTIATEPGNYRLTTITAQQARGKFPEGMAEMDGHQRGMYFESAIGHESTAQAMTALLGFPVTVNRHRFAQSEGQEAICLRVRGRVSEGQILDAQKLGEIGYDLYLMERLGRVQVTEPLETMNLLGPYTTHAAFANDYDGLVEALRYAKGRAEKGRKTLLVAPKDRCPQLGYDGYFDDDPELRFLGWSPTIAFGEPKDAEAPKEG